jgi:hypothetical protein
MYVIQPEIFGSYQFKELLGEGSYGKVFLGHPVPPKGHKNAKINDEINALKLDSQDISKNINAMDSGAQTPITK